MGPIVPPLTEPLGLNMRQRSSSRRLTVSGDHEWR